MKQKTDSIAPNFPYSVAFKDQIALNIQNFYKNHLREGVVGSGQNMAARKNSWTPLDMKNQSPNQSAQA